MQLADLLLEVESVTDLDPERAAAVGRAFDADPDLRPRRVGGDPARIRVETSLEDLIRRTGLPIDWLTVRTNSRKDGFEGGEIVLRPGRGGYTGTRNESGDSFFLIPNRVVTAFLRTWVDAVPDRLDRIAALFTRLCEAIDACYGTATVLPRPRAMPPVDVAIGDIGWLNFYGPAFVKRWPRLADTGLPTRMLANGGVSIRIADTPWDLDDAAKRPVASVLGSEAFVRPESFESRGVFVPSYEDHMSFSPGSTEMPWISGERERSAAKAERARERRYANARRRRESALTNRTPPVRTAGDAEWSTSFDTEDWRTFGRRVFRQLGGELGGPLGSALLEEIASSPLNHEESLVVATSAGTLEVHWFIDDVETVDIYFLGSGEVPRLIDAIYQAWSEAQP